LDRKDKKQPVEVKIGSRDTDYFAWLRPSDIVRILPPPESATQKIARLEAEVERLKEELASSVKTAEPPQDRNGYRHVRVFGAIELSVAASGYPEYLPKAFEWTTSPQGHSYWAAIARGDRSFSADDRQWLAGLHAYHREKRNG
jgi:hypothetical protein